MITECIELSDDDTDDGNNPRGKSQRVRTDCLNVECKFGEEYIDDVPLFVLTYYKVEKLRGLKVCCHCFDEACNYFSDLKDKFLNFESIYAVPPSQYKPVHNIDSDVELISSDDEEKLDDETMEIVRRELPSILRDIMTSENAHFQLNDGSQKMNEALEKLKAEQQEQIEKLRSFQLEIDNLRKSAYKPFQRKIVQVPEIEILDVQPFTDETRIFKSQLQRKRPAPASWTNQDDQSDKECGDVIAVSEEILTPPTNLPPPGNPIVRPKLKPGDLVYVRKDNCKYTWKKSCITAINEDKGYAEYQIKTDMKNHKKSASSFTCRGNDLAYVTTSLFRFSVGVRVIAVIKDGTNTGHGELQYNAGIVAEPPKAVNKFRYLIFFDDGCVQYVPHEHIRLICEPSKNLLDDVPVENRDFLRNYLSYYPERPMVKLIVSNIVEVLFQGNWLRGQVMEVDGSLANIFFPTRERQEWIYRGSSRLRLLFNEFQAAKYRKQTGHRGRIVAGSVDADSPYVEYTRNVEGEENSDENVPVRAVARKSTSAVNKLQKIEKHVKSTERPIPARKIELKLVNAIEPRNFVAHQCGPPCVSWTGYKYSEAKGKGPLAIPLYYGFRRIICYVNVTRRVVIYKAPCGRSLRNMLDVHRYLRITKSSMTVDLFDFDYWVHVLAEFKVEKYNLSIEDVSNGVESVPINCVNYVDSDLPNCMSYLKERLPRENVNLNLDPNFLCGCDCTDDCQDRSRCACWKMTYEGQKLIPNNVIDPNVGYHYRRLPERVLTGIYECNQNCKCSKTSCLNRVVQYPLSQKLQLFKTEKKGWGVRCLTDVPQGAFISVYAGHLLTDTVANEEGKTYGDEYLAELDYIEVIERIKEDYESDVPEDLEEDLKEIRGQTGDREDLDSSLFSSDEVIVIDEAPVRNRKNSRYKLRERKAKQPSIRTINIEDMEKKKRKKKFASVRTYYGDREDDVYIMDAKGSGNIGRYLNHSCMPNVFVQNVFVDTHDLRFPWVSFFAQKYINAGSELTWDYNYDIGSVEGTVKLCYCGSPNCRRRLL